MAMGDPATAGGLLSLLFTEVAVLVLFHGTPLGTEILHGLGMENFLEHAHG